MRRRLMGWGLLASATVSGGVAGCGPVAAVQLGLVVQGREGLRRVEAARRAEFAAASQLWSERRARLDAAFDADARARGESMAPAWVIEARRAYAAGLDSLADARARREQADAAARDNAAAADEALAGLQRMLDAQAKILPPEEGGK